MPELIVIETSTSTFGVEIPEVVEDTRYTHTHNPDYALYRAGEWSFELPEEDDIKNALEAIGAWIAWYKFLEGRQK